MTPALPAPPCSGCGRPATLVSKVTRFRRGDRVLQVEGFVWQCQAGCPDPVDGSSPHQFSTFELMEWEEGRASEIWQERFGEPMPASQRARRPEDQRTVRVPLLLTPAEAERLDRLRGRRSRADFVRGLLNQSASRGG